MPTFSVHLAETSHFIIPVQAVDTAEAREKALLLWRDAPTTGQWQISDTDTDILSVMQKP